jgi:putative ABC transport system permease protein
MTLFGLALKGLWHYRRTHAAVVVGVACAVAVLAGAWLVGASVRASLTGLVTERLGRTDLVVGAEYPFYDTLGDRLRAHPSVAGSITGVAPMFVLEGLVTHQPSSRRAGKVSVYGVDERFFQFHGVTATAPELGGALLSPDLAAELGTAESDSLVLRVTRPTDIPLDSLHSKKDDVGQSIRLRVQGTLPAAAMGEFSLAPSQGPVRAIFVSRLNLQRSLLLPGRVNALLLSRAPGATVERAAVVSALDQVIDATDLGLTVTANPAPDSIAITGTVQDPKFPVRRSAAPPSLLRSYGGQAPSSFALVETASGLMRDEVVSAVGTASGSSESITPVLSWLANRMTVGEKSTPYSLVAGLGPQAAGDAALSKLLQEDGGRTFRSADSPIVLNDWLARDLAAKTGDTLEMEYYRWANEGRLVTDRATFRVAGIVPIEGLAADRRLAPPYPGITNSTSVANWDPPFPIDLKLVRPADEEYWDRYRTTAKAFISLEAAQRLWSTRYGKVTSLRVPLPANSDPVASAETMTGAITRAIGSAGGGLTIADVRTQNIAASAGATDFGAYFSYFSFFLVVSALLLTALFFRLGVEQRLREIGVLRATGYSLRTIQKVFVIEGALVAVAGAIAGAGLAVAWASLMMYGLRTWWVGAVGTTALTLHVDRTGDRRSQWNRRVCSLHRVDGARTEPAFPSRTAGRQHIVRRFSSSLPSVRVGRWHTGRRDRADGRDGRRPGAGGRGVFWRGCIGAGRWAGRALRAIETPGRRRDARHWYDRFGSFRLAECRLEARAEPDIDWPRGRCRISSRLGRCISQGHGRGRRSRRRNGRVRAYRRVSVTVRQRSGGCRRT